MSLRWSFGSTAEERGDIVAEDAPNWSPTSAVFKVGRELSDWLFRQPLSPPATPKEFLERQHFHKPGSQPAYRAKHMNPFIHTLPQELIGEIFQEYVHGTCRSDISERDILKGSYCRIKAHCGAVTTPVLLGHVCSSWRTTAWSTPSLWSNISAVRPEVHDIPLLSFWLARSTTCLLNLRIIQRIRSHETHVDSATQKMLLAFMSHCNRWRTVSLQLEQDMEKFVTSLSNDLPMPSLQEFHLSLLNWSPEGSRSISQLLCSSPRLRSIGWDFRCGQPSSFLSAPWHQLTDIQLGVIGLPVLFNFLSQMRSVESLLIDTLFMDSTTLTEPFPHNGPPIHLSHLHTLSLGRYPILSPLLNSLILPSLSRLSLLDGFGFVTSTDLGWPALSNFIERSGCSLRSLSWSERTVQEGLLIRTFEVASRTTLPLLEHLNVSCGVGSLTVESLTQGPEPSIFPHLRSLELRDCLATSDDVENMILSRPKLEFLKVNSNDHYPLRPASSQN